MSDESDWYGEQAEGEYLSPAPPSLDDTDLDIFTVEVDIEYPQDHDTWVDAVPPEDRMPPYHNLEGDPMNTTPAAQLLLIDAHEAMKAAVETETYDTPQRAYRRMEIVFGLYDDENGEPDQAIRDLLTDVMHEARRRGVEVVAAFNRAEDMHLSERRDWGLEREEKAG